MSTGSKTGQQPVTVTRFSVPPCPGTSSRSTRQLTKGRVTRPAPALQGRDMEWKEIEPGWWVTEDQRWSVVEEDAQEWSAYENAFNGRHLGIYRTRVESMKAVEKKIKEEG